MLALKLMSTLFRIGWPGGFSSSINFTNKVLKDKTRLNALRSELLESVQATDNTKKLLENPKKLLDPVIKVLKSPSENEKGALILNYSYYFPVFLKLFDAEDIIQQYNIILEPSWAGYCETEILIYSLHQSPTYILTFEDRDKQYIQSLDCNFKTVPVGPNWFVDHDLFSPPDTANKKDFDIIMVASWGRFKRHHKFFSAIETLKKDKPDLKIALVGYPADLSKEDILTLAREHNIFDLITVYEWISPAEVAELYKRSKISVLWSRFEGPNRAVIESMLCDTPVIMREGFNYGQHYSFMTEKSGLFANEHNLPRVIMDVLTRLDSFDARNVAMKTRSCIKATEVMDQHMKANEQDEGRSWSQGLATKINDLHGMGYYNEKDKSRFTKDYEFLASRIKSGKNN
jgi:hypothetical protein